MTWIKMDDHFPEDPDTLAVGEDAAWLHFLGIAYCSRNLTDGHLPKAMVARLTAKKTPHRLVASLVKVGWWIDDGDTYLIRSYLKHQRSREQVDKERDGARTRAERSRRTKRNGAETSRRDTSGSHEDVQEPESETEPEAVFGDVSTSLKTALIHRLNDSCGRPDLAEATAVVEKLSEHVALDLIDQCVGWALHPDSSSAPRHPRYFLTVATDWARQRGLQIPDLKLEAVSE